MPRRKTVTEENTEQTSKQKLASFLQDNKESHYNFEEAHEYKVSSGSLILDYELEGGFGPGLHRFVGFSEGGKSSQALQVIKNFLETIPNSKAVYIKAEGRLGPEMRERSGVPFVFSAEEWDEGSCFVFESNIYETAVDIMRVCVEDKSGTKYAFILDSVDGLIAKNDIDKTFEESSRVAGGAVIAATLMKKISITLAKRGHMAIFISQVRADIQLDPYTKAPIRQTTATGGNALLHFANWILEFEPRFKGDMILENPSNNKYDADKNKFVGHWAKIVVKKSPNEKSNSQIRYPIRYGRTGGNSIWVEKELVDMLLLWDLVSRGKAGWLTIDAGFLETLKESGFELPEKIQGEVNLLREIEKTKGLKEFLFTFVSSKL